MSMINLNEKDTEYCISSTLNNFVTNDELKEFKTSLDIKFDNIDDRVDEASNKVEDYYCTLDLRDDSLKDDIIRFNNDLRGRIEDNNMNMKDKFSMLERSIESRMKTINAFLITQSIIIVALMSYIIAIR